MERADQVLAQRVVDADLAADRAVDLRQQRRRAPARPGCRAGRSPRRSRRCRRRTPPPIATIAAGAIGAARGPARRRSGRPSPGSCSARRRGSGSALRGVTPGEARRRAGARPSGSRRRSGAPGKPRAVEQRAERARQCRRDRDRDSCADGVADVMMRAWPDGCGRDQARADGRITGSGWTCTPISSSSAAASPRCARRPS